MKLVHTQRKFSHVKYCICYGKSSSLQWKKSHICLELKIKSNEKCEIFHRSRNVPIPDIPCISFLFDYSLEKKLRQSQYHIKASCVHHLSHPLIIRQQQASSATFFLCVLLWSCDWYNAIRCDMMRWNLFSVKIVKSKIKSHLHLLWAAPISMAYFTYLTFNFQHRSGLRQMNWSNFTHFQTNTRHTHTHSIQSLFKFIQTSHYVSEQRTKQTHEQFSSIPDTSWCLCFCQIHGIV